MSDRRLVIVGLALVLGQACGLHISWPRPVPSPSASATPAPSPSPTAEPSPSPVATPTPAPSATPTPAPTPQPQATPAACTLVLTRVGVGYAGGIAPKSSFQCTYRFGPGNGKPCDGGHPACGQEQPGSQCEPCGGRVCEDARGCVWSTTGPVQANGVEDPGPDSGYRFNVKRTGDGPATVTACPPPPPLHDRAGKPVPGTGACSTVEVP